MNDVKDIPLEKTIPDSIRRDETVRNICAAIRGEMEAVSRCTGYCLLLPRIDEMSESLIDELAWQYHVDFYDQSLPISQKREMVKLALENHRKKGTAAVIQNIVAIIMKEGYVEEWYEYGGEPYHFRVILIAGPMTDTETLDKLMRAINEAKNVRSWLDYVQFHRESDGHIYFGGANCIHKKLEITSDIAQRIEVRSGIYFGGANRIHKKIHIEGTL